MKKKLLILIGLVAIFAIFIGVRFLFLTKQNQTGRLKIVSSPSAGVFIDNVALGHTPYEDKYKVGEYVVKLIPEGDATETASWQGKVKIYKNSLTYINRDLGSTDVSSAGEIFTITKMDVKPKDSNNGQVYVETEPAGAIVYLDNDEKGVASMILDEVPKGDHELSVSMPGFFSRREKINIEPGYRVSATFKLAIDQSRTQDVKEDSVATDSAKPTGSATDAATKTSPTPAGSAKGKSVIIKDTPTGFLRVRSDPTVNASESARVKPGDKFEVLEEKDGWYKIPYQSGKEGWISAQYADRQ